MSLEKSMEEVFAKLEEKTSMSNYESLLKTVEELQKKIPAESEKSEDEQDPLPDTDDKHPVS